MTDKSSSVQQFTNQAFQQKKPDQFNTRESVQRQNAEFDQFMTQSSSNFQMNEMSKQIHQIQPHQSNWTNDFQVFRPTVPPQEFETIYTPASKNQWANQFQQQQQQQSYSEHGKQQWANEFQQQSSIHQPYPMTASFVESTAQDAQDWNDQFEKYKIKHQDWAQEFEKYDHQHNLQEFYDKVKQDGEDVNEELHAGDSADWQRQFQEIWSEMQESKRANDGDWAAEFKDIFPADLDTENVEVDPVFAPCEPYVFENVNQFLEHPDPFQAGLLLLKSQGSLSLAALAFEAAVQRDEHNSEAWMLLGKVQAENEKELPAIAALQKSVQENPQNLEALMTLAVSYINEGQSNEAYASLERWIKTQYPVLEMKPVQRGEDMHERLTSFYLQAVHSNPTQVDSNLQIGLGLLFYNIQDYEKTIDCFTAALSTRPDDYLLWNRLGATLSNSGKNEEAIDAYHKALELKPTFVRARYNLGVSCMNIGCYQEAAEHFLSALALHDVTPQKHLKISSTLWDTLQRTFVLV